MPIARAVDILEQMCAALARAHDLGVVHRDLKSDNILLTARGGRKDFVKILDFGLAALARDPRLAPKGAVFGTPEYMSPEQARGEDATRAVRSVRARRPVLRDAHRPAAVPLATIARRCSRCSAPRRRRGRAAMQARHRAAGRSDRPAAAREGCRASATATATICTKSSRRFQRSLPVEAARQLAERSAGARAAAAARAHRRASGVGHARRELPAHGRARATRTARVPPELQTAIDALWELASRASRLEGEVASHTRKLDATERRGRALRAEIGRKVEELATEESRALREAERLARARARRRAASFAQRSKSARRRAQSARGRDRAAATARRCARCSKQPGAARARHGGQPAHIESRRRVTPAAHEARAARAAQADRRAAQSAAALLGRARKRLDHRARPHRAKVKEALGYEQRFGEASTTLVRHLRERPECRDMIEDLVANDKRRRRPPARSRPQPRLSRPHDRPHAAPPANRRAANSFAAATEVGYSPASLAEWRNRQTRRTQNPVPARACRFDPDLGY